MALSLKFETREININGNKSTVYYINDKEVEKYIYDTLKVDYDQLNTYSPTLSNKQTKQTKQFEQIEDDTDNCICPVCDCKFSILELIEAINNEDLSSFDYFEDALSDILSELYEIAYNDGQVNGLMNIANISCQIAEKIIDDDFEDCEDCDGDCCDCDDCCDL